MFLNDHSLDVANFAAANKERPVLSSLSIQRDRCVATDSYTLLEVMHQDQDMDNPLRLPNDDETGLIPSSAALHASKNIPKPPKDDEESLFPTDYACSSVNHKEKTMLLASTDIEQEKSVEAKMIDGQYPKYESVFPEGLPVKRLVVDAKYLKRMADYMNKHADGRLVEIQLYEGKKPMVFKALGKGTSQAIRGMIMPCSTEELRMEIDEALAEKIKRQVQTSIPDAEVEVEIHKAVEPENIYEDAKEAVLGAGKASASLLQRRLKIGYAEARKVLDRMEKESLITDNGDAKYTVNVANF